MAILKSVIPAAGFGTRMLSAAKVVPKELLPVLAKPVIEYVVEESIRAGARDVTLVTSPEKPALVSHFHHHPRLEQRLARTGKGELLADLNRLIDCMTLHVAYQDEPLGLGHAVLQANNQVGDAPFLCLLGDTIFTGGTLPAVQLSQAYETYRTTIIGLEEVPEERVSRYGIVGGTMIDDGVMKVNRLVEKPDAQSAPSRYAIAARYVLTPGIFSALRDTKAGKGGELQLTDALNLLLAREPVHGVLLNSIRHDIGNPFDWMKTNLLLAANDPTMWKQIRPTLESLLK